MIHFFPVGSSHVFVRGNRSESLGVNFFSSNCILINFIEALKLKFLYRERNIGIIYANSMDIPPARAGVT